MKEEIQTTFGALIQAVGQDRYIHQRKETLCDVDRADFSSVLSMPKHGIMDTRAPNTKRKYKLNPTLHLWSISPKRPNHARNA
jgi:hypothetical protein